MSGRIDHVERVVLPRGGTWRDLARPIVEQVLRETKGQPEAAIRKALVEAYPFGQRKYWPYQVWLDEVRRQRGFSRIKRGRKDRSAAHPDQADLFGYGDLDAR